MNRIGRALVISFVFFLGLAACGTADPVPVNVVEPDAQVQEAPLEEASEGDAEVEAVADPEEPVEAIVAPEGVMVFQLIEGETEARFIINEVLRGEPKTVIGKTSAISGEIFINLEAPSASEVG
jgi:hypothetical protein